MGKIVIDAELCKGCMLCTRACPVGIISRGETFNSKGHYVTVCNDCGKCSGCRLCAEVCPDVAIEVWR